MGPKDAGMRGEQKRHFDFEAGDGCGGRRAEVAGSSHRSIDPPGNDAALHDAAAWIILHGVAVPRPSSFEAAFRRTQ